MGRQRDVVLWGEWRERLGRFEAWDSTVADFGRWEGISQATFYGWRRKLASAAGDPADACRLRRSHRQPPMFVEIVMDARGAPDSDGVIVVRLARYEVDGNGHVARPL